MARNILVLWRWSEALACEGQDGHFSSVGGQMRGVQKGDRLFISAKSGNELYLLGLLKVRKVAKERSADLRALFGKYRAYCRNLSGAFKILPLGRRKWQLRFVNTDSDRLNPQVQIALQVRAHRSLSDDSADLLANMLGEEVAAKEREQRFLEGERRAAQIARAVRSAPLRLAAKRRWGERCYCCGFSFGEFYGPAGAGLTIIHHLEPLGHSNGPSRSTSVDDVRVICANCHHLVHQDDPVKDVEALKRQLAKRWTTWSHRGVHAR